MPVKAEETPFELWIASTYNVLRNASYDHIKSSNLNDLRREMPDASEEDLAFLRAVMLAAFPWAQAVTLHGFQQKLMDIMEEHSNMPGAKNFMV